MVLKFENTFIIYPQEACPGQYAKGGVCTAALTLTVGCPACTACTVCPGHTVEYPCWIRQKGTLHCSNSHNLFLISYMNLRKTPVKYSKSLHCQLETPDKKTDFAWFF